jgi:hypothetical protein
MAEIDEESKRVEQWLTKGRPRAIRTRGAAASAPGVTDRRIEEITALLEQLTQDVPEVPWIVVVDGRLDACAEKVWRQVKKARESAKFWLVGSEQEIPQGNAVAASTPLRLNPQKAEDLRFLENLVVDLAIIVTEPKSSQRERLQRWLPRARYVLAKENLIPR